MVAYRTGSDPIEIGNIGLKVKVTVIENVCRNDEKKISKNSIINIFENKSYHLREHFVAVLLIPNMTILLLYIVILNIYSEQFAIKKK